MGLPGVQSHPAEPSPHHMLKVHVCCCLKPLYLGVVVTWQLRTWKLTQDSTSHLSPGGLGEKAARSDPLRLLRPAPQAWLQWRQIGGEPSALPDPVSTPQTGSAAPGSILMRQQAAHTSTSSFQGQTDIDRVPAMCWKLCEEPSNMTIDKFYSSFEAQLGSHLLYEDFPA